MVSHRAIKYKAPKRLGCTHTFSNAGSLFVSKNVNEVHERCLYTEFGPSSSAQLGPVAAE